MQTVKIIAWVIVITLLEAVACYAGHMTEIQYRGDLDDRTPAIWYAYVISEQDPASLPMWESTKATSCYFSLDNWQGYSGVGNCKTNSIGSMAYDWAIDTDLFVASRSDGDTRPLRATLRFDNMVLVDGVGNTVWQYNKTHITHEGASYMAGDATADGLFDSADMVTIFQAGKYETGNVANWYEGDFSGDFLVTSADLVVALQTGLYNVHGQTIAVPEPSSVVLWLIGVCCAIRFAGRRRACGK